MLKISKLTKIFEEANDHKVLDDLTFNVPKGKISCILGPSGCGKTVLLYLIAGFIKPTSGKIVLDDLVVEEPGIDRIMVFQDYVLFPWKTVFSNVLFGLEKSDFSDTTKNDMTHEYLNMVGLTKYSNWYPYALSGGMQQRVALARALISNPKVLLMDEPFSALDSQYRCYMRESLEKIWQKTNTTILFVTHSVGEAVYLADDLYLFSHLPARIIKKYRITMPRPRLQRSQQFVDIVKDIEDITSIEFKKSLDDPASLKINEIIKNLI